MQFEIYLSQLQKSHNWSEEFILPAFGAWLGNEFFSKGNCRSIGVVASKSFEVPLLSVLLSGLRCLSPENEITLVHFKSKDPQGYSISRVCKCLGVYKTTEISEVESCEFIFREETIEKIRVDIGLFLRRLFAEAQRKLTLYDKHTYLEFLKTISEKKKSIEGFDYILNQKGDLVFSPFYHLERGYCCESGCINCPYGAV